MLYDTVCVRFAVMAEADPGLMPRLLQPLARRDLIPESVRALREGEMMRVDLLATMPAGMVHLVAGNLGQIVGVRSVLVEEPQAERSVAA
jgi:hypothetical protein